MRLLSGIILVLLSFAIVACGTSEPEPLLSPLTKDGIDGERLWERITEESTYSEYQYWPEHAGELPGQSPHGVLHRIYVNRTLMEAVPISGGSAPFGSIVVKDNLDAGGELRAISVMAKIEGYDPENNDWFWATYGPDGSIFNSGSPRGCIACHEGVADNDYVIVRRLDLPLE